MTKLAKIEYAVFKGETLTTMKGAYEFGTTKLPTRLGEIERRRGVTIDRIPVNAKDSRYYEYRLDLQKHKEQVKNYFKSIKN